MSPFFKALFGNRAVSGRAKRAKNAIRQRTSRIEPLEGRCMLSLSHFSDFGIDPYSLPVHPDVTTFDSPANHVVATGTPLDGVVELIVDGNMLCTGTLLPSRREILTAAHCVAEGANGAISANSVDVVFHLSGGDQTLTVAAANFFVDPAWNGDPTHGHDMSILVLPQEAPAGVASFDIDRTPLTSATTVQIAGYGLYGQGIEQGLDFNKRQGLNTYQAFYDVADTMIMYDFDDGTSAHDAFGQNKGSERFIKLVLTLAIFFNLLGDYTHDGVVDSGDEV